MMLHEKCGVERHRVMRVLTGTEDGASGEQSKGIKRLVVEETWRIRHQEATDS